jgi:HK97 family phage major capsid protein
MWLKGQLLDSPAARQWSEMHGLKAAANTGGNAAGAVLVPGELAEVLIDLRERYGVFRRFARIEPMAGDVKTVAKRTGHLTAYWVNDGLSITLSDISTGSVQLHAKKLGVLTKASSEITEDSIAAWADMVVDDIAWAFAKKEDECGFIGDATSTYAGMTGVAVKIDSGDHAASIATAATGNVSFETLDMADFTECSGLLPDFAERKATWFISKKGYGASMQRLSAAAGLSTRAEPGSGFDKMFLDYGVVFVPCLNSTLGSDVGTVKCLFGDLGLAAILGSKRETTIDSTRHRYFESDTVGIKGTERFDVNVHSLGDATDAGAVVALKTAAS